MRVFYKCVSYRDSRTGRLHRCPPRRVNGVDPLYTIVVHDLVAYMDHFKAGHLTDRRHTGAARRKRQ